MNYRLVIPDESHEAAYTAMMDQWEASGKSVHPHLLRRYSKRLGANVSYARWLEWCKDDRTTGSMLETGVPCTLYFLSDDKGALYGAMAINHGRTHRGHMHAGIAPWCRSQGLGTEMLRLALEICREMGMDSVEIVPYKGNAGAVQTILRNGGTLLEEFEEEGEWSQRYRIFL